MHLKINSNITHQQFTINTLYIFHDYIFEIIHAVLIVHIAFDDVSSDSEDDQMDKKPLNLRKYQKELSADANDGKRCVIVAPTGSGKTHVIIDVIQVHMTIKTAIGRYTFCCSLIAKIRKYTLSFGLIFKKQ